MSEQIERLYRILDLEPGASLEEVKEAYRSLLKVWHPDRFFENDHKLRAKALSKTQEINAAYKMLTDILSDSGQQPTNEWQETNRRQEEEIRRKAEEERRRQEEASRRYEEYEKRKAEDERKRQEEEDLRQFREAAYRKAEEEKRIQEEGRKIAEEKQKRKNSAVVIVFCIIFGLILLLSIQSPKQNSSARVQPLPVRVQPEIKNNDIKINNKEILTNESPKTCRLFVQTYPQDATIKILNIKPRFYQGIEINPGKYHLEISAEGYETKREWITVEEVKQKNVSFYLSKVPLQDELKKNVWNPKVIGSDGRFFVYDYGFVIDAKTGLMWAAEDNRVAINWYDAKLYCENYRGSGYSDWRMPTSNELAGLYDGDSSGYKVIKFIHLTSCCLWTSERNEGFAGYFDFGIGRRDFDRPSYDASYRALPVRANK